MTGSPLLTSTESSLFRRHRLDCAALTAAGRGRAFNEDRCVFAAPGSADAERAAAGCLFAVVGGNPLGGRGRSATNETATSLLEILDDERRTVLRPDLLAAQLHAANDRISQFIRGRCVATAVWIWEGPDDGELHAGWAHVGDARLYLKGRRGWRQVTRDHARGRLLDRAIGGGPGLEVDTGRLRLRPGERLVLLTDGTWRGATPGSALAGGFATTADATRRLVGQARLNGGADDTSAVVVTVRDIADDPEPEH